MSGHSGEAYHDISIEVIVATNVPEIQVVSKDPNLKILPPEAHCLTNYTTTPNQMALCTISRGDASIPLW